MDMIPILWTTTLISQYATYSQLPITTEWESLGEDIEYELQFSFTEDYKYIQISHWPTTNTYQQTDYLEDRFYCRRIRYKRIGEEEYNYKDLDCFYFNKDYEPPPEETPPVEKKEQEDLVEIQETLKPAPNVYIEEEKPKQDSAVLGIDVEEEKEICEIQILKRKETEILDWDCNLGVELTNEKYINWGSYFTLELDGKYKKSINADLSVYSCKPFSLFDPQTWFQCKKTLQEQTEKEIEIFYDGYVKIDATSQKRAAFNFEEQEFWIKTIFSRDVGNEVPFLYMDAFLSFKTKDWIDLEHIEKIPISNLKKESTIKDKPFSFPIERNIGVTQWHGCTEYQCPHKGIDFGARLNKVLSVGDGIVVNVGYDKYGGECNQGGDFVIIKHTNGMYSTYFHLDHYNINVGDQVKEGSLIGISRNSGKWNCQNLGYHLHFETRKGLSSSTHVNPVDYINIDWNLIPTIGYSIYPGRLSGDNPHPNF